MQDHGGFDKLWNSERFTSRLISVVWDEAHCISLWGDFRPEYKEAARLRYLIPKGIPFFLASATLPPVVLSDVLQILAIRADKSVLIQRSNDRANIHIVVRKLRYSLTSFHDLAFLIPDNYKEGDPPPPKFLIFFDNITTSVAAAKYLQSRLPLEFRHVINWFNSDCSPELREELMEELRTGKIWGLCCTDSCGMVSTVKRGIIVIILTTCVQGVDLPDVKIIIQWRVTCDLSMLWQRIGRGVRQRDLTGIALILAEPKHFDDEKEKRATAKEKREKKKKAKAKQAGIGSASAQGPVAVTAQVSTAHAASGPPLATQQTTGGVDDNSSADENDAESSDDDGYAEDRRDLYSKRDESASASRKRKRESELSPAMDDMINARFRKKVKCHRAPPMLYFGNDKTSTYPLW